MDRVELPQGPLVVALSGGADSSALAYLCKEAAPEVRALHVDHGLTHSGEMARAAAAVASRLGLGLDVARVGLSSGPSIEAIARDARYRVFTERVAADEALLTAHTRDDHAETVLFNLIRGTGARGLAGIPPFRPPNVWRPLLAVSRSETRELATLADLPFVDDPMNDQPDLARTMIRARVLPTLEELNPGLVESVSRMAGILRGDLDLLERLADEVPIRVAEESFVVAIGDLVARPRAVADRVLITALAALAGQAEVTAERLGRIRSVVEGVAGFQEIAGGVTAERKGPLLVLERTGDEEDRAPVVLTPGVHKAAGLEIHVTEREEPLLVAPLSKWMAVFPAGTRPVIGADGVVRVNGDPAWVPGETRHPIAWYEPGSVGYVCVFAREEPGWT